MIEYLSIYRQTCKLTIGKLFEKLIFTKFTSFVLAGNCPKKKEVTGGKSEERAK